MAETDPNLKSAPQDGDITFDFDGDGIPDLTIRRTNGHTAYVNIKWLITAVVALATTVIAYLGLI